MNDKNGTEIRIGDMLKFKSDRYTQELGIVKAFTTVADGVLVSICGGGGTEDRTITASNSVVVNGDGVNDVK